MGSLRVRTILILLAAAAVAVFGVIRLVSSRTAPAVASPDASIDGLSARVTAATWAKMDHNMASPGAQSGPGSRCRRR